MIQEASITGLLRTIFIIVGVIAVLRFIGRFLILRREREKLKDLDSRKEEERKAKEFADKNKGRITISKKGQAMEDTSIDVNFKEVD